MTVPKQLPIAAAIAGVLAAIGISVKLATTTDPLEARVDELIARVSQPKTPTSENLKGDIDELTEVVNDPGFAKLPAAKQENVRGHLREFTILKSYKDFEKELADVPEPKSARSAAQLKEISRRLNQLSIPENLPDSFQQAEAIERRRQLIEDANALLTAFDEIQKKYEQVLNAGKEVLNKKNEPNLPARIKEVLTLAENLKTPQKDKDKPLPGASRLTYATVFQMSEIENLMSEWNKLRETLEPALKSSRSDG
jgi:hypothetical protein